MVYICKAISHFLKLIFTQFCSVTPFPLALFLLLKHRNFFPSQDLCTALQLLSLSGMFIPSNSAKLAFHALSLSIRQTSPPQSALPQYYRNRRPAVLAFILYHNTLCISLKNLIYLNNSCIKCLTTVYKVHEGLQFLNHSIITSKFNKYFLRGEKQKQINQLPKLSCKILRPQDLAISQNLKETSDII